MQRRPSVDVVSTSIRRRLNVNTTLTLKQRQFNTCMTPMSVQRYFYAYGTHIISIRRQLNDVSVDMTPTRLLFCIYDVSFTLMLR